MVAGLGFVDFVLVEIRAPAPAILTDVIEPRRDAQADDASQQSRF
jgi:hypothetical protein